MPRKDPEARREYMKQYHANRIRKPLTEEQRLAKNVHQREYQLAHPEQTAAEKKRYRKRHRDELNEKRRTYQKENWDKELARTNRWRDENREHVNEMKRARYATDPKISQQQSDWRRANKNKSVGYTKAWQKRNPDKVKAISLARKDKPNARELYRKHHLQRLYGMTVETYQAILEAQGGVCDICGAPPTQKRRLAVDHNHDTGKPRGLLCNHCNRALERFEKYPDYGDRVLAYLTKYLDRLVRS
jgi:hypothetical protein